MGAKEKLFRQKLANQIEKLLTHSEAVFGNEKLTHEWVEEMVEESQELIARLTIFKFLHQLPEDANLEIEFLEMSESEKEPEQNSNIPNYGDEILKEINEFESSEAIDVELSSQPLTQEQPTPPVADEVAIEATVVKEDDKPAEAETPKEIEEIAVAEAEAKKGVEETVEEVIEKEPNPVQVPEPKNMHEEEKDTEPMKEVAPEVTTAKETSSSEKEEAPKFDDTVKEINDMVAPTEPSLAEKLSAKSIKKLAESIALNERFLYSNELFNGNMEAFKRALNELDHIASLEDAKRYLEVQLKEEYQWNMDTETVQNFISLVERRFV